MDYKQIYKNLINKARSQNRIKNKGVYYELHHIIPKCLRGKKVPENEVLLTAREHFIAHLLLTKIYPRNPKIWCAFNMMTASNKHQTRNNRLYSKNKIEFQRYNSIIQKERLSIKENHPMYGKKHSAKSKKKNRNSQKGKTLEERLGKEKAKIVKQNMRKGQRKRYKNLSERQKLSESQLKRFKNPKEVEKISRINKITNSRPEVRTKISKANKGKNTWSREMNKDRIYINNNNIVKAVKKEELDKYLVDGWEKGRIKK